MIGTDVACNLLIMLTGTALYAWYAVKYAGGLTQLPGRHLKQSYGADTAARFLSFTPPLDGKNNGEALAPFLVIVALAVVLPDEFRRHRIPRATHDGVPR